GRGGRRACRGGSGRVGGSPPSARVARGFGGRNAVPVRGVRARGVAVVFVQDGLARLGPYLPDIELLARDPSLVEVLSQPGPPPSTRFSDTAPSVEVSVGKIVAAEYVSVDGVMQDPGGTEGAEVGGGTNPYWDDELAKLQTDLPVASAALLLGRVT